MWYFIIIHISMKIARNVALGCGVLLIWQAGEWFWPENQFLSFSDQYNQKLKNISTWPNKHMKASDLGKLST